MWIQFFRAPLKLFTQKGLSYIASAIGSHWYMGRITASRSHLAFAKICVEVPVDVVIPRFIIVMLKYESLTSMTINVSWMPSRCSSYKTFNHSEKLCSKKVMVKKKRKEAY